MIASGMEQFQTKKWPSLLPRISFNLNTSKSTSTKYMPFEIVFIKNQIKNQTRIDRSGTDLTRIAGKVCKKGDHKEIFYTVLTQYGILADNYRAGDLKPYSGLVEVD